MRLLTISVLFISIIFTQAALAWQLRESTIEDYNAIIAVNKNALEAWLSAIPDDQDGMSFKQLARGVAYFAEKAPMMQQDDFSEYLSTFPSLFMQADIPRIPANGANYTNDDLSAKGGKGGLAIFWLKTNFDSC
ncbi:MAG: hypothetical protein FWF87_03775 [Synergistaceae bacterium]|nr:hypothetical protein [Synergistaceae bacterium]